MNISFGPVPGRSAPLSEELVFLVFVLGIVFVFHGARSRPQAKTQDVIIFIAVALALMSMVVAFRWL